MNTTNKITSVVVNCECVQSNRNRAEKRAAEKRTRKCKLCGGTGTITLKVTP